MGGDDDAFARLDFRRDGLMPVRQKSINRVLQTLGQGDIRLIHVRIANVVAGVALVTLLHGRRRHIVRTPPDEHLIFTVFLGGLRLVQSLQGAVVPLVQAPIAAHRQPHLIQLLQRQPQRADGAFEYGRISLVEDEPVFLEHLPGTAGLGLALLGEVHIVPAGKPVFQIPLGLSVTK